LMPFCMSCSLSSDWSGKIGGLRAYSLCSRPAARADADVQLGCLLATNQISVLLQVRQSRWK
jgi:hypothetical protein